MKTKKFTILHSNDMHGDFLAEAAGKKGKLIGGLALLSGYINQVRKEEENVLYLISGDMVQGSLIDAEYKGISTMEIMNYIAPDVVALGNHEFDYGLPHLLFLTINGKFILLKPKGNTATMFCRFCTVITSLPESSRGWLVKF